MEFAAKISLLKPVRLRLKKELAGPYMRLLRRPAPEVDALATGKTTVIIRGTRFAVPDNVLITAILVYPIHTIHSLVLHIGDVCVYTIGLDLGHADWAIAGSYLNDKLNEIMAHNDKYVNQRQKAL